jgi:hypothetical protein
MERQDNSKMANLQQVQHNNNNNSNLESLNLMEQSLDNNSQPNNH